jgi:hypothetical protein
VTKKGPKGLPRSEIASEASFRPFFVTTGRTGSAHPQHRISSVATRGFISNLNDRGHLADTLVLSLEKIRVAPSRSSALGFGATGPGRTGQSSTLPETKRTFPLPHYDYEREENARRSVAVLNSPENRWDTGTSEHLSSPLIRSSLQSCNTAGLFAPSIFSESETRSNRWRRSWRRSRWEFPLMGVIRGCLKSPANSKFTECGIASSKPGWINDAHQTWPLSNWLS